MYFKAARLLLFGLGLLGAGALFGAFGYALAGMTFAISGLVSILLCTCVPCSASAVRRPAIFRRVL